jgi:hypothetical protein
LIYSIIAGAEALRKAGVKYGEIEPFTDAVGKFKSVFFIKF